MAGPLPEYRTGNRPLIINGVPVHKRNNRGEVVLKRVLKPNGEYRNGRPTGYTVQTYPAIRHETVPRLDPVRPSRHARGRIRPRTAAERTRVARMERKVVQYSKSDTVDRAKLTAFYDEV